MENLAKKAIIQVELSEMCRACMAPSDNKVAIYPNSDQHIDLITMLTCIANCEIELDEHLPRFICSVCVAKLRFSYDFIQLVQRSNELLRERLKTKEIKPATIPPSTEPTLLRKKNTRGMRLTKFPWKEVKQEMDNVKKAFATDLKCIKCGFLGCRQRALSLHVKHVHEDITDTWCMICNALVENLDEHKKSHNDYLKCRFCAKKFIVKQHLVEHLHSHSDTKHYACDQCGKKYLSSSQLNGHKRIHDKIRLYKCKKCSRNFILKSRLKIHERTHLTKCSKCNLLFENKFKLETHICGENSQQGGQGELLYECQYCDEKLHNIDLLNQHEATHDGEAPYVCSHCGKSFALSRTLKIHKKIHGKKMEVCEICGKSFHTRGQLEIHLRNHTGDKPYLCTVCGKSYSAKGNLTGHFRRSHTNIKPFQCHFCGMAFTDNTILKNHEDIHLGNRPFKCKECPYAAVQSGTLNKHMKIHKKQNFP